MSEIETNLSFPLDDDGFFRRECPLCYLEFKVLLGENELSTLGREGLDSFLLEGQDVEDTQEDIEKSKPEFRCPYCGQRAPSDDWWTQEQLEYVGIAVQNIVASMVNEQFIRPMKRMTRRQSTGPISFRLEGQEMRQQEPWISPEVSDMEIFDLPCCQRKIKVDDKWTSVVYCFFCGFPHKPE